VADRSRPTPDDLDAWVLATAPDAVAFAVSLLRNRDAAEDVVQDCYCRLLQKTNLYDLPRDGRKLLFTAITNACINLQVRGRPILSLQHDDETSDDPEDRNVVSPEHAARHRELEEAVADALAQLPMNQRAALELKCLGHSLQEIGEALGVTANNAGVLIHRARQAMADRLARFTEEQAG
jgi:RNA polymerase sigma-70 factor (ECF subfamily)